MSMTSSMMVRGEPHTYEELTEGDDDFGDGS